MFKSFRVGSIFGIPIKLDITLLIVLPAFAWIIGSQVTEIIELLDGIVGPAIDPAGLTGGTTPWLLGLAAAVGLFIGVTLHELGHSVVAMRYGYRIDSITLWLLGGVAQFTEQPRDWTHEFWIAIAGPVVSVGVGIISYLIVVVLPGGIDAAVFVFGYLAVINVGLAVFNMVPAFPLDGGRVLRAIYGRKRSLAVATEKAVRIGKIFAVLLGLLGILTWNIFLIAVAFFVYMAGSAEGQHTAVAAVFEDVALSEVTTPAAELKTVTPEMTVEELIDRMLQERHSGYPVVEGDEIMGMVTIEDVKSTTPEDRAALYVSDIMTTDLKTIPLESTAMEAFTEFSRQNVGRLLVVDGNEFVGIVTRTDLVRAFEILRERRVQPSRRMAQVPQEQR